MIILLQKLSDDANGEQPGHGSPRRLRRQPAAALALAAAGLPRVAVADLKPKQPHAGTAAAAVGVQPKVSGSAS